MYALTSLRHAFWRLLWAVGASHGLSERRALFGGARVVMPPTRVTISRSPAVAPASECTYMFLVFGCEGKVPSSYTEIEVCVLGNGPTARLCDGQMFLAGSSRT